MDLRQLLFILRARYRIALLLLLATVAVTVGVSSWLPKQYTATTSLVIDSRSPDPLSAIFLPNNLSTQVTIIESDRVAQKAVKLLKLDENPTVKNQWAELTRGKGDIVAWLAGLLDTKLKVQPEPDASVIDISYTGLDPAFAASVANAFAQAYIDTVVALKVGPAAQYASWFEEQMKTLRANLEQAQARLSDYQQQTGIVVTDARMDAETAKLNELSSQLTAVEGKTVDALSKQRTGNAAASLPSVPGNGIIEQLRAQIDQKEADLQDAAVNFGTNYPKYRSMQAQLDELKRKLAAETAHLTTGFSVARTVGQHTESELKAAIEAQKQKILDLKMKRDHVDVLKHDADTAQATYDAVARRLTQSQLESHATETNVTVLTPAVAPGAPSFPKPMRIMLIIALFLGTVLGVGAALLMEMIDRRVRSATDLAEMLQMPVLGVIQSGRRRRGLYLPRRKPALLPR